MKQSQVNKDDSLTGVASTPRRSVVVVRTKAATIGIMGLCIAGMTTVIMLMGGELRTDMVTVVVVVVVLVLVLVLVLMLVLVLLVSVVTSMC